jgi:hypothetical protein
MSYDFIIFASFPIVDYFVFFHINNDIKWKTLYFVYPLKITYNLDFSHTKSIICVNKRTTFFLHEKFNVMKSLWIYNIRPNLENHLKTWNGLWYNTLLLKCFILFANILFSLEKWEMYIGKFINMEFLLRGMRGNRRYFNVFNRASFQKLHINSRKRLKSKWKWI